MLICFLNYVAEKRSSESACQQKSYITVRVLIFVSIEVSIKYLLMYINIHWLFKPELSYPTVFLGTVGFTGADICSIQTIKSELQLKWHLFDFTKIQTHLGD